MNSKMLLSIGTVLTVMMLGCSVQEQKVFNPAPELTETFDLAVFYLNDVAQCDLGLRKEPYGLPIVVNKLGKNEDGIGLGGMAYYDRRGRWTSIDIDVDCVENWRIMAHELLHTLNIGHVDGDRPGMMSAVYSPNPEKMSEELLQEIKKHCVD